MNQYLAQALTETKELLDYLATLPKDQRKKVRVGVVLAFTKHPRWGQLSIESRTKLYKVTEGIAEDTIGAEPERFVGSLYEMMTLRVKKPERLIEFLGRWGDSDEGQYLDGLDCFVGLAVDV